MAKKQIIVIGGGPAGMMAAIAASLGRRRDVTLIEKNLQPGKKLLLTGNGRCNLTNACCLDTFLAKFGKKGPFLRDAFKSFFNTDLMRFFKNRGLECKIAPDGRVFPRDDKALSVLKILNKELSGNNVRLISGCGASGILTERDKVSGVKLNNGDIIRCDSVILATGGLSYPSTGSTGDGFGMARELGHTIMPLSPALVPLIVKETHPRALAGLALHGIKVSISSGGRTVSSGTGDILFTPRGVTGPLILSLSGTVIDLLRSGEKISIIVDQFPGSSEREVHSLIDRGFRAHPSMEIKNNLKTILPWRVSGLFLGISRINPSKMSNQVTRKELLRFAALLKAFLLTVTGSPGMGEAMITRGGVSLKEIAPRTMASRLVRGLYFAGEIIDVDGDTGGFNLQAAFSTGHLAGVSASNQ